MKKVGAYLGLVLLLSVYAFASYEPCVKYLARFRYAKNSIWSSDKYRYGDLFGLSYLPGYKEAMGRDLSGTGLDNTGSDKHVNLVLVHDSYLGSGFLKSKSQLLPGIDTIYNVEYPWWRHTEAKPILLDTSKNNVLVFEIAERSLVNLDSLTAYSLVRPYNKTSTASISGHSKIIEVVKSIKNTLFNNQINQNIEFVLFEMHLFTSIKEFKSQINYILFDEVSPLVSVSKSKQYLLLSETQKSLIKVDKGQVKSAVLELNSIYRHYRRLGFKTIYFSIIPNPIDVIKPERANYNGLIPLIQNDDALQMPMIDIYSIFSSTDVNVYYHSDSHWNKTGFQMWVDEFNRTLAKSE